MGGEWYSWHDPIQFGLLNDTSIICGFLFKYIVHGRAAYGKVSLAIVIRQKNDVDKALSGGLS